MNEAPRRNAASDLDFSVTEIRRADVTDDAGAGGGTAVGASVVTGRTGADRAFTATDSPCVAICSTLFDEICRGCGRSAMEVANWVFMTDEEKQVVWTRILAQGYPRRP